MATSGSFSDRMSRLLTGEDGEETVLSRYDLTDNELEGYKQDILNDKMLVVANSDRSSHDEVEDNNAAYKEVDITHYAAESEGPKSIILFLNYKALHHNVCVVEQTLWFLSLNKANSLRMNNIRERI